MSAANPSPSHDLPNPDIGRRPDYEALSKLDPGQGRGSIDPARLDPNAMPRCKWLSTWEDEPGNVYITWHRAGETFNRTLRVTQLCMWKEEINGFEPYQAMRFGIEFERMCNFQPHRKAA